MPLVQAREAQLAPREEPIASTSKTESDNADNESMAVDGAENTAQETRVNEDEPMNAAAEAEKPKSKRAYKREKAAARLARRQAAGPVGKHQMTLKSGKVVHIPDYISPDKFEPKLLLDKGKARDDRPEISQNLVLGINAVTRVLEAEVHNGRRQLAGLSESKQSATQQDSLRIILPAPTKSTRKQKRALREEAHPAAKAARLRKLVRQRKSATVRPALPPQLAFIPRDEPTLLHTLSEARGDVGEHGMSINVIETLEKAIRGVTKLGSVPDPDQGEPIAIPLEHLNAVLSLSRISKSTKSILTHLYLRFIPGGRTIERQPNPPNDPAARDGLKKKHLKKPQTSLSDLYTPLTPSKPIRILFVAKGDINPPSIVQHLLTASAARNSVCAARRLQIEQQKEKDSKVLEDMYVVPMGEGFEHRLCELLAVRRAAVLAISVGALVSCYISYADCLHQDCDAPGFDTLLQLLKHHLPKPVTADWLMPTVNGVTPAAYAELLPTHVKQLAVEIPTDPKAARTEKKAKRAEVKGSRKRQREEAGLEGNAAKKAKADSGHMELVPTQVV